MPSSSHLIDSVADTTAHRDRDDLDHAVARLLVQFLDAQAVSIYRLLDDDGTTRVLRCIAVGPDGAECAPPVREEDLSCLPALSDVPSWQACVMRQDAIEYAAPAGGTRAVFPIQTERTVMGFLEIATQATLEPRDTALVAGILRIMKNHLALLEYGERDTLTGLLNRKTFEARFDKLRLKASRANAPAAGVTTQEPSWLGVVDIDKFKSINDTYGHLFGDEVLLLVAQLIKKTFRGGDLLFRFGGEEFVIVLERATTAGAQIAFERLRAEIESFQFPQVGRVTISLGYTRIDPLEAAASGVERADAALYYAKHHGRNLVHGYEPLIASGELEAKKSTGDDIELF